MLAASACGDDRGGADKPSDLNLTRGNAAAHASCFLYGALELPAEAGSRVDSVKTEAAVALQFVDGVPTVATIALRTVGRVPGVDEGRFKAAAEEAKQNCAVSQGLAGVGEITQVSLA